MADSVIPTRQTARVGAPSSSADARSRPRRGDPHATRAAGTPGSGPSSWRTRLHASGRRVYAVGVAIFALLVLYAMSGVRVERQDVGHVGVVRNGGPFDSRNVRQVLLPGQKITFTGWFSQSPHQYPAAVTSRTLRVTGDNKAFNQTGVEVVTMPTRDGIQVGLEGTLWFRFVGERNTKLTSRFDVTYGTRQFTTSAGKKLYPWQGEEGYAAMTSALLGPILESNLRQEVGSFECAQLVASCALVQRGRRSVASNERNTSTNIAAIQNAINRTMMSDSRAVIGLPYFIDMRFVLSRVTLPAGVQKAVDEAQAEYAGVSRARADLKQARYRTKALKLLAEAYNRSPGLARIEALKAIPPSATVIMSTDGQSPSVIATPRQTTGTLAFPQVTPSPPDTSDKPDTPDSPNAQDTPGE